MKNYKIKTAILSFLFLSSAAFGQQAEKTLVKSFNVDNEQQVTLDLPGQVEVKHWNNKVMRVQMTITLENGSVPMLKSLITAGRYNLTSEMIEGNYTILAPNFAREIKLRGAPLKEKVSYIVYSPENVHIQLTGEASTSTNTTMDGSSL